MTAEKQHFRVWPPPGAGPAVHSAQEEPSESEPVSLEGLVSNVFSSVPVGGEKTSADWTSKNMWRSADTHPIIFMMTLLDKYGPEYVEWDPDVLRLTLQRDGIALSNSAWNKILAGRVVLFSPSPWRQWEAFHWTCRGLMGVSPNFVYLEEPEIGHMVVGYEIMKIVDPKRPTSMEVDKYVAGVFQHEGLPFVPTPLDFAQRELEEPEIECKNCGARHRDDNDIKCITCSSSKLERVPYEYRELRDEVSKLFAARRKLPLEAGVADLPDSGVGTAVYRLLVEWHLADEVRDALKVQLRTLGGR